jgi:ATP-dependent helicase/nuclease subunit B
MRAVAGGAPLPASGIELVCRYCDVRGLCRKGGW